MKSKEAITKLINSIIGKIGVEFFSLEHVEMLGSLANILWVKEIDEKIPIKRQDEFGLPFQLNIEPCSGIDHWIYVEIRKDDETFRITGDKDELLKKLGVTKEDIDVESLVQVIIKIAHGAGAALSGESPAWEFFF